MSWTKDFVVYLLPVLFILSISTVVKSTSVRNDGKADERKGVARQVFMPESDASNFFKRRSRRSVQHYLELQAEQRVRMANNERRREYNEEQRNEYENYVEEERDEQTERTRETSEQFREFHYDGLHPRFHWFH